MSALLRNPSIQQDRPVHFVRILIISIESGSGSWRCTHRKESTPKLPPLKPEVWGHNATGFHRYRECGPVGLEGTRGVEESHTKTREVWGSDVTGRYKLGDWLIALTGMSSTPSSTPSHHSFVLIAKRKVRIVLCTFNRVFRQWRHRRGDCR